MKTYTFIRAYDGGWDVWHNGRLVAEDFETVTEALAWLKENRDA